MENKEQFVNDFQEALIKNGDGRYDYLMDKPIRYVQDEIGEEFLTCGHYADGKPILVRCVSADSLPAIAKTMLEMI